MIRLFDETGRSLEPPAHAIELCREMAELPEELRRRVAAARGLELDLEHGDVGAAGGPPA